MSREEIVSLHAEAQSAFQREDWDATLRCYVKLENLQPDEPTWPRGSAVVFKKLGRIPQVVAALSRAAKNYQTQGQTLKAAALCKQILAIDEKHRPTRELLKKLHAEAQAQRAEVRVTPVRAPTQTPAQRPESWVQNSGAPLEQLHLRKIMPGVTKMVRGSPEAKASVYQIHLHDEAQGAMELEASGRLSRPPRSPSTGLSVDQVGNVRSPARVPPPQAGGEIAFEDQAIAFVAAEVAAAQGEIQKEDTVSSVIAHTPLFAELSPEAFSELIDRAQLIELEKNKVLFHQGAPGNALYVVAEGTVGVVDEGPPRRGIAKLVEGDFFGEIALVTSQPRNATIIALEDGTHLIEIDLETIRFLIAKDPHVLTVLLRFFRNRLVARLLSTNPLFTALSQKDRELLKSRFRFLEVEQGATLIQEGERPEGLLMLLSGHAEVIRVQGDQEVRLAYLSAGDVAGEISLVTQQPAIASVRAGSKCFAIELPSDSFHRILQARPEAAAFIKHIIERRTQQAQSIVNGEKEYAEGRVSLV